MMRRSFRSDTCGSGNSMCNFTEYECECDVCHAPYTTTNSFDDDGLCGLCQEIADLFDGAKEEMEVELEARELSREGVDIEAFVTVIY